MIEVTSRFTLIEVSVSVVNDEGTTYSLVKLVQEVTVNQKRKWHGLRQLRLLGLP